MQAADPAFVGKLAVAVSDYMVENMEVQIDFDRAVDTGLDAKLGQKIGQVLGKDASLNVKVSSSTSGTYTLSVTKPVILATFIKRQPRAGVMAEIRDPQKWPDWDELDTSHLIRDR